MAAPSLQDGIDKAGSPVNLLWRVNPEPWNPENIEPEYAGWRAEQAAWHSGVSISDLSHHMFDTFIAASPLGRLAAFSCGLERRVKAAVKRSPRLSALATRLTRRRCSRR